MSIHFSVSFSILSNSLNTQSTLNEIIVSLIKNTNN